MCIVNLAFNIIFSRAKKSFIDKKKPDYFSLKLMNPRFNDMMALSHEYIPIMLKESNEKITIKSNDGYKLSGSLYRAQEWNGITAIFVHGYQSRGCYDHAHIGYKYLKKGFNVLLVDNRACGDSEGVYTTFGVKEAEDLFLWVKKINELIPESKIVLQGGSLGGATVCNASAMDMKNVISIIADCPFADPKTEFSHMVKLFSGLSLKSMINKLEKVAIKKGGFDFTTINPIKSVANSKYPILFIHGKGDAFIPCECQDELYNACTSYKEKVLFDGVGHCGSQIIPTYFDKIFDFINRMNKE